MQENCARDAWSPLQRILFRFVFLFFVLACLPADGTVSVLDVLPWGAEAIGGFLFWPLQHLSVWTGAHLFHLSGDGAAWHPTGSGDTAMAWTLFFCCLVIATAGCLVWSLLDRKRCHYRGLNAWLRLIVAFTLGVTLLVYGFVKIFESQFPPLPLTYLTETYGDSTPMRLLWAFMGSSPVYTAMTGAVEATAGLLLLFRRTRTVGALLAVVAMTNVVALNFCYDVPVKLYSSELLLQGLYLLWPAVIPLWRLLVLRQQAQLLTERVPASERRHLRMTGRVLQAMILLCAAWTLGYGTYKSRYIEEAHPPLYGYWKIDAATSSQPQTPWVALVIETPGRIVVRRSDGRSVRARITAQTERTMHLKSDALGEGDLAIEHDALHRTLQLTGKLGKAIVQVRAHRIDPDTFLLKTQGFHWVHEYPPNR